MPIPWSDIDTVFLDAGNTLVSIDFGFVAAELSARGLACTSDQLRRAEAAARPSVSAWLAEPDDRDPLRAYFGGALRGLPQAPALAEAVFEELLDAMTPVLFRPGRSHELWCEPMPGIHDAIASLRALGLDLVVVSNSDGTCEHSLRAVGLFDSFSAVHDSHHVGIEKPDARFFEHALSHAGADPARTVHVGDMHSADVVGARAAGVHAVLLDPYDDWPAVDCERLPDVAAVAERLAEGRTGGS